MPLRIIRDDILKVKASAIVNPSDTLLSGSGSIDFRIHDICKDALKLELQKYKYINTSDVILTKSYALDNCDYIIHVAGPIYSDGKHNEFDLLRKAYKNILNIALENNIKDIAIPLISSGTFNFPKKDAFNIAVEEINDFIADNDIDVTLVVYDDESFSISKQLNEDVKDYINKKLNKPKRTRRKKPEISLTLCDNSITHKYEENKSYSFVCQESKPIFELDESFSESLLRIIDEKGLKDADVYKKAGIDRKLFSTIRSKKDYHPSKKTAVSLCIALNLNLKQTNDLLKKAGMTLSNSNLFDVIIEYFIKNKIYDIYEINSVLLDNDQPLIGGV